MKEAKTELQNREERQREKEREGEGEGEGEEEEEGRKASRKVDGEVVILLGLQYESSHSA